MSSPDADARGSRLESAISYLLMAGVAISMLLETIGMVLFYQSYGNLNISQDKTVFIQGRNFFTFIYDQFRGQGQPAAIIFMTLGIIVLMLTPYVRVIVSVVYFAWQKNAKYVLITLFVLAVLTISLALH